MRVISYGYALFTAAVFSTAALCQPASGLRVSGNSRLPAAGVIAASGLRPRVSFSREELDAAAQRLLDTGFFVSVNYRYDPKTGVTLIVSEDPVDVPAALDFPGIDAALIWQEARKSDPLVLPAMPNNERAEAYYRRAIGPLLQRAGFRGEIISKTEADLATGAMTVVFRPAVLPKLTSVEFEGNRVFSSEALLAKIGRLTIGQEYSERDFRAILESNLRPIYEEKGLLTVEFPSVKAAANDGGIAAVISVTEGPAWTLGQVELTGDKLPSDAIRKAANFPERKLANWNLVLTSMAVIEQAFRSNGYLGISLHPAKSFHEDTRVVDLTIRVSMGRRFYFGALEVNGLNEQARLEAQKLFALQPGDPMNAPYVSDYLRVLSQGSAGCAWKSVSQQLRPRRESDVVDVVLTFQ